MSISSLSAGLTGASPTLPTVGATAAVAALSDRTGATPLSDQLDAYRHLSARWRSAGPAERMALAGALTESPFAQRAQATVNAFTRAAWAGADAQPPAPEEQMLKAFDALSEDDQRIVSALLTEGTGRTASPADYRGRLKAAFDDAAAKVATRLPDTITLSEEARARLAAREAPTPVQASGQIGDVSPRPEIAAALAAYAKVGG
jgi:hypothetical protein